MTIDSLRAVYDRTRMVGWDFSRLEGRLTATEPPWDFEADCLAAMHSASRIVDLGTGGGERLGTLLADMAGYSGVVTATEGWEPNLPVARESGPVGDPGASVRRRYARDHAVRGRQR